MKKYRFEYYRDVEQWCHVDIEAEDSEKAWEIFKERGGAYQEGVVDEEEIAYSDFHEVRVVDEEVQDHRP